MWRCLLALALAACTQFPQLDETIEPAAEAADFPELVPLEPILAEAARPPGRDAQTEAELAARAAALRARASALREDVVDGAARSRMEGGIPEG